MKKNAIIISPVAGALKKLGEDIRDARRRRNITMALLAERAGINVITLSKIEKGDPGTSIGGYASVLFSMSMINRLRDIADASHDLTGQMLANERLPKRVRIKRKGT
ncbi:MAG: helix-turn-helix domain-containing protein [Treponema sp.]|nr:helix-turn-helix domain-containing protein [Treponema sp.]